MTTYRVPCLLCDLETEDTNDTREVCTPCWRANKAAIVKAVMNKELMLAELRVNKPVLASVQISYDQ